jgi:hypothetical protein
MPDWLTKYVIDDAVDLPRLLNDDFFAPIKLLFNHGHYTSANKLLLSTIDSLGCIEFGDEGNVFVRWLDAYADLTPVGVTADELWELRNSLLHTTGLESRKVKAGQSNPLIAVIGALADRYPRETPTAKYYLWMSLLQAVANACGAWLESYNSNRSKFPTFCERYDRIVSDARLAKFSIDQDPDEVDRYPD